MNEPIPLQHLLEDQEVRKREWDKSTRALPSAWIERIFEVMAANYGARFADAWRGVDAEKVKAEWSAKLGTLNAAQIRRGIEGLEQCKFPPTLPEFVALCRQAMPESHLRKLPPPRPTRDQRQKMLAELEEAKRRMGWIV